MKTTRPQLIDYIAFLRAINVGGSKVIRMVDLKGFFEEAGLSNVKTYIQSGNVFFGSKEKDPKKLARKIEKHLLKSLGFVVEVFVFSIEELREMVISDPFSKRKINEDALNYVTFFGEEFQPKPKLPLVSKDKYILVFEIKNRIAFSLGYRKKDGHYGFPNLFLEKYFDNPATTRNWNTIIKMVGAALVRSEGSP